MSFTQTFPANLVKFSFLKELLPYLDFAELHEYVVRLTISPHPYETGRSLEFTSVNLSDSFGARFVDELAKTTVQTFDEYRILDIYLRQLVFPRLPDIGKGTVKVHIDLTDLLHASAKDILTSLSLHAFERHRVAEESSIFLHIIEEAYSRERITPFTKKLETVAEGSDLASFYRDKYTTYIAKLTTGMPAYAYHWNDLYNYAESILNYVGKIIIEIKRKYSINKSYVSLIEEQLEPVYLECFSKLQSYEKLKTGATLMPKHTNALIDIATCLDRLRKTLFAIGFPVAIRKLMMLEKMKLKVDATHVIRETYEVWGIDELEDVYQPEIVVAQLWTWWDYRCLIRDNTIFITSVMDWNSGELLAHYLGWFKAVVGLAVSAFFCDCYGSPYASYVGYPFMYPNPPGGLICWCECFRYRDTYLAVPCDGGTIVDPCMSTYIPYQPPWPWSTLHPKIIEAVDVCIDSKWKVPHATPWYYGPGGSHCNYSYVSLKRGYIIELPELRLWESTDILKRYIEALSRCFLSVWPPRRVVFNIANIHDWCQIPGLCEYPTLKQTAQELARRLGWGYREVKPGYCR